MSNFLMAVLAALSINGVEQNYVIQVDGMHCPLCTAMVRKALLKVDGVNTVKASLKDKMARVAADEEVTKNSLLEAIATTGYEGVFIEE